MEVWQAPKCRLNITILSLASGNSWMHWAEQTRHDQIVDFCYPILSCFVKMISESCFGWNHTICIQKLSESVLWCTTYIFVLCLFCLQLLNVIGWSSQLTSLERMSCFADHDNICNCSVPCMDDGCHSFRAGKQLLICIKSVVPKLFLITYHLWVL